MERKDLSRIICFAESQSLKGLCACKSPEDCPCGGEKRYLDVVDAIIKKVKDE